MGKMYIFGELHVSPITKNFIIKLIERNKVKSLAFEFDEDKNLTQTIAAFKELKLAEIELYCTRQRQCGVIIDPKIVDSAYANSHDKAIAVLSAALSANIDYTNVDLSFPRMPAPSHGADPMPGDKQAWGFFEERNITIAKHLITIQQKNQSSCHTAVLLGYAHLEHVKRLIEESTADKKQFIYVAIFGNSCAAAWPKIFKNTLNLADIYGFSNYKGIIHFNSLDKDDEQIFSIMEAFLFHGAIKKDSNYIAEKYNRLKINPSTQLDINSYINLIIQDFNFLNSTKTAEDLILLGCDYLTQYQTSLNIDDLQYGFYYFVTAAAMGESLGYYNLALFLAKYPIGTLNSTMAYILIDKFITNNPRYSMREQKAGRRIMHKALQEMLVNNNCSEFDRKLTELYLQTPNDVEHKKQIDCIRTICFSYHYLQAKFPHKSDLDAGLSFILSDAAKNQDNTIEATKDFRKELQKLYF